ncbi:putative F-box-like domain superfamily protein [Helianthus anomalus]
MASSCNQGEDFKELFLKVVMEEFEVEIVIARDPRKCFDAIKNGVVSRDLVSKTLHLMPPTAIRDLALLYKSENGTEDVELMSQMLDLFKQVNDLKELKRSTIDHKMEKLGFAMIVDEIFTRLPAKAIGRLKCVSKDFRNELSTHMFEMMHSCRIGNSQHKKFLSLQDMLIVVDNVM